jgi:hypothetical protein
MVKSKESGAVVKIDSSLLLKIDEIIKKEENRLKFVNKKHFIDLAVNEFLEKLEKNKGGKDD